MGGKSILDSERVESMKNDNSNKDCSASYVRLVPVASEAVLPLFKRGGTRPREVGICPVVGVRM